jgi:hypothetical protein
MSDKKHIDRLFQEKFKDFEAQPSAKVWENIQNQLEQPTPKHKKAIPLWAKAASIAALLLLFISIGNLLIDGENGNNTDVPPVVDTNSKNEDTNTSNENINKDLNNNAPKINVVDSKNTTEKPKNSSEDNLTSSKNEGVANNKEESNPSINNNNTTSTTTQKTSTENRYNSKNTTKNNTNEAIANTKSINSSNSNNTLLNNKTRTNNSISKEEGIVNTNKTLNKKTGVLNTNNKQQVNNTNGVVSNTNNKNNASQSTNATNKTNTSFNTGISSNNNNTIENELNTTDAIAIASVNSLNEKEKENITVDLDYVKSNAIEEAIAKNQNIIEKEKDVDRWCVNANIAPVYYNTLGKGSHIHDQFIDNPKNGELNTSYGIQVGYAFNNRLKVRSGISKLNLSYDTANVIVYENVTNTPGSNPLRNIDFIPNRDGQTLSVLSTDNLGIQQINDFASDKLNAALSQRIDYIEVPLELEYTLVNKRFGVNVIGGVSTFILNDNEVVTEVDNRKTLIGKANNINNISFSTNFGIGIDYKFSDTFKFNIEPTFKYQINAFSETSGDFKPYIIGVYTGFSYKF